MKYVKVNVEEGRRTGRYSGEDCQDCTAEGATVMRARRHMTTSLRLHLNLMICEDTEDGQHHQTKPFVAGRQFFTFLLNIQSDKNILSKLLIWGEIIII